MPSDCPYTPLDVSPSAPRFFLRHLAPRLALCPPPPPPRILVRQVCKLMDAAALFPLHDADVNIEGEGNRNPLHLPLEIKRANRCQERSPCACAPFMRPRTGGKNQ